MTIVDVTTQDGPLRGLLGADVARFEGIPFAAPPVGSLRFAPPARPTKWTEPRDAFAPGSMAAQNPSVLETMLGADEAVVGEDCLTLNVFAPAAAVSANSTEARPVMVWIHGGGFLTGSGSIPWYDGSNLASRNVVVVTINYRLGVLGFLHLADLVDGFEGSANLGLLDQIAALEWVRDNIAAFGGDPGKVTVFGESAGAMSVGTLLAVPSTKGLFQRAIMQSGAAAHTHDRATATEMAGKFLAELGIDPADPTAADALRAAPLAELLEAQSRFVSAVPFEAGLPLQPVVDGFLLPGDPLEMIAQGCAAEIDILIGTNSEEMKMFLLIEPSLGQLEEAALGIQADELLASEGYTPGDALRVYRADRADAPLGDVLSAVLTDHTFRMPAIRLAQAQSAFNESVWMYQFAYQSPAFGGVLGACHALDVPFVWDNLDARGAAMFAGEPTDAMRKLAARMADAWTAFATNGEPVADSLVEWPRYEIHQRATMHFDQDETSVVLDPAARERQLWALTTY